MKLSGQIRAAAKRLTPETWNRGCLFENKRDILCMCAHGALQTECNPSIKKLLDDGKILIKFGTIVDDSRHLALRLAMLVHDDFIHPETGEPDGALTLASFAGFNGGSGDHGLQTWENRPDWVRETDPERGNLEAHYLLGMVGLTVTNNDDPGTTLQDVLEKFEESAKLAESLGV